MNARALASGQPRTFIVLAVLGLIAQVNHVHIPHTELLIDGRWIFGFMGFALLHRWWAALLLAAVLSAPLGANVNLPLGLGANLLYALPALLVIRPLHRILLDRQGPGWAYGLGWFALVMACYQAFVTPVGGAINGLTTSESVSDAVLAAWRTQPFLIESLIVAMVSASLMVAYLAHTRLQAQQQRLAHLNRVLKGIRNVNQLIVSEDDPQRLIERACTNLTATMGYHNAWIALLDDDQRVTATASSGFNGEFAVLEDHLTGGEFPDCMAQALACNHTVAIDDPPSACRQCPLARAYGGRAGLSCALRHGGKLRGVMAVSVPATYADDAQEQDLFTEVAGDLAFAMQRIESERQMEHSRTMLSRTEAIANIGSWEWSIDTDQVRWSDELFRIFGWDPAQGAPPFAEQHRLYPPQDMANLREAVDRCISDGTPFKEELRLLRTDGEVRWCISRGQPEYDATGRVVGLAGSLQDITDRKQAEAQLAHSYDLMRYVIEHANSAVAVHDRDLRYIYVSKQYLDQYGIQEAEVIGKHHYDVFPDLPQKWRDVHQKALAGEASSADRDSYEREGGPVQWTRWECRPWYEADGSIGGLIVYTEVITEQVLRENALREQQALLEAIYRNAPLAMMLVDSDRRLRQVNDFTATLAGRPAADALGLGPGDALRCLHSLDDPRGCGFGGHYQRCIVRNTVLDTLERGATHLQVEAALTLSGDDGNRDLTFMISSTPLTVQDSRMALVTMQDISDRRILEDKLAQAHKMEAIGRLAGGVAHDFNNMLQTILGYADMLLDDTDPAHPSREALEQIQRAGLRSADLTRQLLAFARKQTVAPQVLDMNAAVADLLTMLQRLIGEDIDLLWHPCDQPCRVKIDPGQVDQILANLVVNSRDAIVGNGKITIETGHTEFDAEYCRHHPNFLMGSYCMLAVSDDGAGMDRSTAEQAFEPFFTTKEPDKGTGLGLATVYGIVKQNQGFINIYSEPGKGTTIRVYLPVDGGPLTPARKPAHAGDIPKGSDTLLLVEDEPALLKLSHDVLTQLGYTVLPAGSPADAIRLAAEHRGRIDALITDVVMPQMSGRELWERLSGPFPQLRCLFMSGYTANVIAHHGVLDAGVHFLQKPFSAADLARKLREILDQDDPS
jgi:PAS domain S-box-containing protein